MRNINESLEQIIENLLLIKNKEADFSQIDKDILLQNLREAYLAVLRSPVAENVQNNDNQIENESKIEDAPKEEGVGEKTVEEPVAEVQDSEISSEEVEVETETPATKTEEKAAKVAEEPLQDEEEEMDTDILEFIKDISQATIESKPATKEPELFAEPEPMAEPVSKPEPEAEKMVETVVSGISEIPEPEPVVESVPEPEPIIAPEPQVETIPVQEPEPVVEPVPGPEVEKVVETVVPEISKIPEPELKPEPEPVVEPLPVPKPVVESEPEPKVEIKPEVKIEEPVKPQQRSLNDLFNEQKQDLGDKFQQTKIGDLTKAMSINDKFLFIRELFKNKSEEFSRAIQTLNNCENIEEAFDIMEGLKKQYFWDSTSSAYLALCDLVRRKF